MIKQPYGTTIFCDDIRQEISGKHTLVGCYMNEMNFNGPAPGMLPVFSAYVKVVIPISIEFSKIKFLITKEEGAEVTEILSQEIDINEKPIPSEAEEEVEKNEERVYVLNAPFRWTNFTMNTPGQIKVRVYLDDEVEIKAGTLKVNFDKGEAA